MTTSDDEIKKAEHRGYTKGYAAGRRKLKAERLQERERRERQAFLDKVFLAALPTCIEVQGWNRDGKPITTLDQRTRLAWDFAAEGLRQRRKA